MVNTTTITREIDGEAEGDAIEIEVTFNVTPIRGCHTLRNGDPGYPDEGGEVEILSAVRVDTGEQVELTDAEVDEIESDVVWNYDDYGGDDDDGDDDDWWDDGDDDDDGAWDVE